MDPILWDSSIETGHLIVDTQHQAIFKAFNRLLTAMNRGKGVNEIHMTLLFLKDYTQRHFTMEEGLMEQNQYPGTDTHRLLHREFIEKLEVLMDRSERGASVTVAVMQFVKDWLLNHIQIEDKRLAQYLAKKEVRDPSECDP